MQEVLLSAEEAAHRHLLETDADYKELGVKWMEDEGKDISEMAKYWDEAPVRLHLKMYKVDPEYQAWGA